MRSVALFMFFCSFSVAQNQLPASAPPEPNLPFITLGITSTVELSGISEPFLANSVCSSDNKALLTQLASGTGLGDIVAISQNGKQVVRFGGSRIDDIAMPEFESFFATDSGVYILTRGSLPTNQTIKLKTPAGQSITQPISTHKYYIARFRLDGGYEHSVPLDLPFSAMQIGVFPNGDFLIAGIEDATDEPKVGLFKSNGQFTRYVELKNDITAKSASADDKDLRRLPRTDPDFSRTLRGAASLSAIVPDGPNLLLLRVGQHTPVFSVSMGGEVRSITPQVPKGFAIANLAAGNDTWTAIFQKKKTNDPRDLTVLVEGYAINPASGEAIGRYIYPNTVEFSLVCRDGNQFAAFGRQGDKLALVILEKSGN